MEITLTPQQIAVERAKLTVWTAGRGPAVLLVHGFPDDHSVWRHQVPALVQAGYRVVVPDMRGCGESSMPKRVSDYRLAYQIEDLQTVVTALGLDEVHLVGHDLGAVIAWQFAMAHPELVRSYAALSVGHPRAYATDGVKQKLMGWYAAVFQVRGLGELLMSGREWALGRRLLGNHPEVEHWARRLKAPGRLTAAINFYRANIAPLMLRRDYPPVTMPVMGVWSDGDRYLTESQMTRSEAMVTGSWRYHRVERASHWLQLDQPEQVNRLLLDFMAAHPVR